jgi:hypothetical protein
LKHNEWKDRHNAVIKEMRDLKRYVNRKFLVPAIQADPVWAEIRVTFNEDNADFVVGAFWINSDTVIAAENMNPFVLAAWLRVSNAISLWREGIKASFPEADDLELIDGKKYERRT